MKNYIILFVLKSILGEMCQIEFYKINKFLIFVWFDSLLPINNLSVIKGRVFLG